MANKRKQQKPFACVSKKLLITPPIRHSHTPKDKRYLFTDEFAVAVGAMIAAREFSSDIRHRAAFKAGAAEIERDQENHRRYRNALKQANTQRRYGKSVDLPRREHAYPSDKLYERQNLANSISGSDVENSPHKPIDLGTSLIAAGKHGYSQARNRPAALPPIVKIEISKRGLLRLSGVKDTGHYYNLLSNTLDRLTKPIAGYGPVLKSWRQLPSGQLQLDVSSKWLKPPFDRLPWPPPTLRSPTALALYLFLFGADTRVTSGASIRFERLIEKLGISTTAGNAYANKILNKALATINDHLAKLNKHREGFDTIKVKKKRVLPARFGVHILEDGNLQFTAIPYREPDLASEPLANQKHETALSKAEESTKLRWGTQ